MLCLVFLIALVEALSFFADVVKPTTVSMSTAPSTTRLLTSFLATSDRTLSNALEAVTTVTPAKLVEDVSTPINDVSTPIILVVKADQPNTTVVKASEQSLDMAGIILSGNLI